MANLIEIAFQFIKYVNNATCLYNCVTLPLRIRCNFIILSISNLFIMTQDKMDQQSEQSDGKSKLPSISDNLTIPKNRTKINILETEEQEVRSTSQRRPQFRIKENSRRRFY